MPKLCPRDVAMLAVGPVNWTMLTSQGPWTWVETCRQMTRWATVKKSRGSRSSLHDIFHEIYEGCFNRNPGKKKNVFFFLPKYKLCTVDSPLYGYPSRCQPDTFPRLAAFILKNPPGALDCVFAWLGESSFVGCKMCLPRKTNIVTGNKKMAAHRFSYQSIRWI